MTWNWAALIAALSAAGTALFIGLRWRRAPQTLTAMVAVAVCFFVAGAVFGAWVLHLFGQSTPRSAPSPGEQPSVLAGQPSPIAFPAALPNLPAPAVSPSGYYCGTARWAVKTLSDEESNRVNFKPVPSTVAALVALPRPTLLQDNHRAAPVELTTYVVRGVLVETSAEKDNDIHVVIGDPGNRSKTIITEVVDPGCQGAINSPELTNFRRVRATLDILLHSPPSGMLASLKPGEVIEVTGVGFFDTVHGQTGVAPNAIELHPVLDIRRID